MQFTWTNKLFSALPTLGLVTVMALPISSRADENDNKSENNGQAAQAENDKDKENDNEKDASRKLKIFKLQHRDPQQLNQILGFADQTQGRAMMLSRAGQPSAAALARSTPSDRGGSDGKVLTAVNADKKLLFVRGTDDQLSKVEELVKALDVEDDELQAVEYRGVRLLPVRSSDAAQLQGTLSQLQLHGQLLRMGEVSLVAIHGDETNKEETEQAEEVIKQLNPRAKDADSEGSDSNNDRSSDSDSDDDSESDSDEDKSDDGND